MHTDFKHLIPQSLHPTYDHLQGPLKNLLIHRLFPAGKELDNDIAILALDILAKSPKIDVAFDKLKERFLIGFIQDVNLQIKTSLEKVHEITKGGFFQEFIDKADSKKTQTYTPEQLTTIIDTFYSKDLPVLKKQKHEKEIHVQSGSAAASSSLVQSYDCLMACQKYYALPKLTNDFLGCLQPQKRWRNETYASLFRLLNVTHDLDFDDNEKTELVKTIFRLHSPKRKDRFQQCSDIELGELFSLCAQLKTQGGEELLEFYLSSLGRGSELTIDEYIRLLNLLLAQIDKKDFFSHIEKWGREHHDGKSLIALLENKLVADGLDDKVFEENIDQILARFEKDLTVVQPLSSQELGLIRKRYPIINQLCKQNRHLTFYALISKAHQIRHKLFEGNPLDESDWLLLIALGRLAIRLHFGIYLYNTQIVALLALLKDHHRQGQVKTGQGKTFIVTLWAFVRSMQCRAPDIITSARYLAVRDYKKSADFFKRCGITSSHICYDRKIPSHFNAQVLFGPSFDFKFAWMGDLLWGSKLFKQRLSVPFVSRNFDVVCVDESDNLLVDTARNSARLGAPAEVTFDWVYAPILLFVSKHADLVKNNVKLAVEELKKDLKGRFDAKNQKTFEELSNDQLATWLNSAHHALYHLKAKVDYVIRKEKDDEGNEVRVVHIVDLVTGRISENSRWSDGIHEFVEIKHDVPVQKETITPLSLSHAVFYQFYQTIAALTGTAERFQTKEIYGIETFDVPPHQPQIRVDLPPIIAKNTAEYYHLIIVKTKECIAKGRPLLILCRSIQDTEILAAALHAQHLPHKLLNEVQEEREEVILSQAGSPGKVTIATNTAGRGTDIILTKDSLQHNGLHVTPTFPFGTKREEDQGIGRGGRQGQPGSSQSIWNREDPQIKELIEAHGRALTDAEIIDLVYKQRDLREKSQAKMQIAYAELERFLATKTHKFFFLFRKWADYVEQDAVMGNFADRLCSIKLKAKKEYKFDHLSDRDLVIANECIRLLSEDSEVLSWKIFLQKVVERMKQKVINHWVKQFFEPTEKRLKSVGLNLSILRAELEKRFNKMDVVNEDGYAFFDNNGQQFLTAVNAQLESCKKNVDSEFDSHWKEWEIHLAEDGSGLFAYIKEITTIDLTSVIFKSKNNPGDESNKASLIKQ